ncbi:hypothetical protein RSOLAG1IB_00312 [Rhizoctonia solani AG-1 IB]|uniref:Uncharacterized protein n=1 Tax=Thanatephorus cucumeris (strain AG1-IB / isolate 7/3/14) TaxID=1108050 RepID=A0A0B7F6B8_THACB|nr:hypothetical protein RSOLAG1IB_00312 [Rhizoctonia solani AG-1 IB]
MFLGGLSTLLQCGIRRVATKASKHSNNFKPQSLPALELASLPPAGPIHSLQRLSSKRGTIRPILNHEPIKPGARVDPTHPAVACAEKTLPYASHAYFSARAYPNSMLKRLGVLIQPNGRLKPLPPPQRDFPIFKHKKRIKFASTYIMPIKSTHKSGVVRVRLKRKLNEAVQLVATRGADVDPQTGKIIFKQAEALESKWLLRDWYYVFYPRTPIYHAPWASVIKVVRDSLLVLAKHGREMDMRWNLELADREAKAMKRLSRREMRRVRMWRRQDQEAVLRGYVSDDVGIRWKLKGMGVKRRLTKETQPGVGNRRIKVLRAPSRSAFQHGNATTTSAKFSASTKAPVILDSKGSSEPAAPYLPPAGVPQRPQVEITQAERTRKRQDTRILPTSTRTSSPTPKLSQSRLKQPDEPSRSVFIKPPSESLVGALRRKPLSKYTPGSGLKAQNRNKPLDEGDSNVSSNSKRRT